MSVLSTFEKPAEMFSSKLGYKMVAKVIIDIKKLSISNQI